MSPYEKKYILKEKKISGVVKCWNIYIYVERRESMVSPAV